MKIRGSTQIMPDTVTPEILENFPSGTVLGNTAGVSATPQYVTFTQLVEETGAITELTGDVIGTGPGIASTLIASGAVTTEKLATLDHINLSLTPSGTASEGSFQWNSTDGTIDVGLPYGVTLQVGQEMPLPAFNDTGVEIAEGVPVYISGRQGHIPEITPARSDSSSTSCIFGITTSTFGTTGDLRYGFVTVFGYVRKIKTNYSGTGDWGTTWAENDKLYVSKTTAGQLTNVEPTAPHHSDVVGTVAIVGAIGTGSILIINRKHTTLQELTDVDGTPLATDGQFPVWNNTAGYFDFNKNINDYIDNALLTTRGDLLYRDATIPARLPLAGVSGSLLTRDANDPVWSAFALGGGNAAAVYSFPAAASGAIPLLNLAQIFTATQTITPASGSGLIVNGFAGSPTAIFQAAATGTDDTVQIKDSTGVRSFFDYRGRLAVNTTAFTPGFIAEIHADNINGSMPLRLVSDTNGRQFLFSSRTNYATNTGYGLILATKEGSTTINVLISSANINTGSPAPFQFYTSGMSISTAAYLIPTAMLEVASPSSAVVTQILRGATSQTANILQIQNSLSAIQTFFTATGGLTGNEQGTATGDLRWESDTEPNMILLDADGDTDGALYLGGSTNGVKINKGGELTLIGTATVWKDIDFPIIIRTTGANIPTLTTVNGNLTAPQWAVNDFNMCESQEFIHEWKEGSTCYFHIHLTTNGLDASDRYVRFEVEYGYATPSGVWTFPTTIDSGDLLIPASTTDKTMFILSLGNFTPTGVEIGGHVLARLKRIAATGTAPTNAPWIPMLQLHVECDSMGSKTISDK